MGFTKGSSMVAALQLTKPGRGRIVAEAVVVVVTVVAAEAAADAEAVVVATAAVVVAAVTVVAEAAVTERRLPLGPLLLETHR